MFDAPPDLLTRVFIDTRALRGAHQQRGIGAYVSSLMAQFESLDAGSLALHGVRIRYFTGDRCRAGADEIRREAAPSLEAGECDLFHATTLEGIVLSPAFQTVATLYDLIPLQLPDRGWWARHPHERLAYRHRLRRLTEVDHIIAISEATKSDACRLLGIAPERMSVVAPAADPARARVPSADELEAARAALDLREPYFLAIASSDRHKNLARVLEAFAAFRASASGSDASDGGARGYRLYLAGTWMGHEARRLLSLIERLGLSEAAVRLPWVPVEHLPALYHGATALVFPSLAEGFGLPALEAMACGTAVITSNRSSLPEVGGDAALYVDPERVGEIAAAMRTVATQRRLRAELVARGLKRSAGFSQERAVRELVAVYRRVAERRTRGAASDATPSGGRER